MADTKQLWEMFKDGKYDVYLSTVTLREIQKSPEPKKTLLIDCLNECDCIISWNFKHILNVKTIRGVRAITNLEGYKMIEIWNPSVLLESEG